MTLAVCCNATAQSSEDYTLYDFGDIEWLDVDGYASPGLFGNFNKVSANGQYAVGYDDQLLGCAFLWNREYVDTVEIVNNDYNLLIHLCDISNDGVGVGSYQASSGDPLYPAYRTSDGVWITLPVPEGFSETAGAGMGIDHARAITPDGNYIAGHVYVTVGETESPLGGIMEVRQLVPCLWTKSGDSYELTGAYTDLGAAGQSYLWNNEEGAFEAVADSVADETFFVYDISNDGRTIVGVNTAETGGQNPAFIRDGKLMQLFDCANEDTYTFNGGICNSIDANGNIYGYFVDDYMENTYFVYTSDGKLEYVDNFFVCGTADGERITQSIDGLPYVLDCSEDGTVIVGAGVGDTGFGMANTPALVIRDDIGTGVDRLDAIAKSVNVECNGGTLVVTGEYSRADIYTAQGALIATGGQGKAFNISGQPAGAYIVKVTTANGVKTFKIAR